MAKQKYRKQELEAIAEQAKKMINASGFALSKKDLKELTVNDFGLGDFFKEGFIFTDILRSDRLRVTCFVLFPGQSLPEHFHPPDGENAGKEETLRVLSGETMIYVPGKINNPGMIIPPEKADYYSAQHEIRLKAGDQYTLVSPVKHWFQGGPQGSVNLTLQSRVDETRNIFTDPASTGCPVKLTD